MGQGWLSSFSLDLMIRALAAVLFLLPACSDNPVDPHSLRRFPPTTRIDERAHLSREDENQIVRLVYKQSSQRISSVSLGTRKNTVEVWCGYDDIVNGVSRLTGGGFTLEKTDSTWRIVDNIVHERDQFPYSLRAYRRGRLDAQRDVAHGKLALEVLWHEDANPLLKTYVKRRYHIEVRKLGTDELDEQMTGHAKGYNEISGAEIKRRYGADFFSRVPREVEKQARH